MKKVAIMYVRMYAEAIDLDKKPFSVIVRNFSSFFLVSFYGNNFPSSTKKKHPTAFEIDFNDSKKSIGYERNRIT